MQLSDFDFPFDPALVATEPTLPREQAKLLVLHPHQQAIMHRRIADLVDLLDPGDLIVVGKPMHDGMYAGGIVATTFGGMAAVVGITLSAVGYAKDRRGMATAGLITGAAGAIGVPFGIYLMMKAVPQVSVGLASPQPPGTMVGFSGRF